MVTWDNPLPIDVTHYASIKTDDKYRKCVDFLQTAATSDYLTATFGEPLRIKRTYRLWILNRVAISGVVQPFNLTFNVKQTDTDEAELLKEIHIIYDILKQDQQWPE